MTLRRRLDSLEDDLSPKELMIRWMGEAHQFPDPASYTLWLVNQPEDTRPFVQMPRHLSEATRTRLRGRPEKELRETLRSRNRDLFFLFYLHSQLNERVSCTRKELTWRAVYLLEQLQHFMDRQDADKEIAALRESVPGKRRRRKRTEDAALQEELAKWRSLAAALEEDVRAFLGAAEVLSQRYFLGADLFYPDLRTVLLDLLHFLQHLHRLYDLTFEAKPDAAAILAGIEDTPVLGPPSEAARDMAAEHVPLAKAEALMMLGEQSAATRVVEEWLRPSGV